MSNTREVILILAEGATEYYAFENILDKLSLNNIVVHVVGTDVTAHENTNENNALAKVYEKVTDFAENSYTKTPIKYIKKIIHLVDTDGTYINDNDIIVDEHLERFKYTVDNISANNKSKVVVRNNRKSKVMNRLISTKEINDISYEIYYFSCDCDHVLFDVMNLDKGLKVPNAKSFERKYEKDLPGFIDFMCNSNFSVNRNYEDSWDFIKLGKNSLNRYSNFDILLKDDTKLNLR